MKSINEKSDFVIDLLSIETKKTFNYTLNDDFFAAIEQSDIQKGTIDAVVEVKKVVDSFEIVVSLNGTVYVTCDRCLDEMPVEVDVEDSIKVIIEEEAKEEEDGIVTVAAKDSAINIAWYLYEFTALSLPMHPVHEEGECNQEMEKYLSAANETEKEETVDPRWEGLKSVLNKLN